MIEQLRCEYLADPLGVDASTPRFSWRWTDPQPVRGRAQTAYRVRVDRIIAGDRESLWDSGRVESNQSVNVEYAGAALGSTWDCRWRVRVWDEQGHASAWSDDARFVMGLLDPREWVGDWIRCGEADDHQHVWFRKSIELNDLSPQAVAYVCSIGYHELYINGRRIGDQVLCPGATNLARRALYMTYDISKALRPGRNVIALWTGPGWARADGSYGKGVWDQTPMCRCQLHVGEQRPIATDTTWRCAISNSENIGLWKGGGQGTYGGERIDARRSSPHWNTLDFDDAHWPAAITGEQTIELTSAMFEPDRKVETLRPVSIENRDGNWRIDFGVNFTGWFEVDLRGGAEGESVLVHTANRLEESIEYDQESEYIFDETGAGTFCHRFNWMAGRWVTLVGRIDEPTVDDIRGYIITNDRRRFGSFECSNGLLNAIFEADLRTYIANTVNGVTMDCPHRERYGYGEVAQACSWGCGIPNYDSAAFYTKVARDWFDVQDETGMVNTIAPQPYLGAGGTLWSSGPVTVSWEMYRACGDVRLLERAYPVMAKWLAYLHEAVADDGVLMPYALDSRFLGDWATPHGNEYGNLPEARLFNNCVYAYNLMVAVQSADRLGRSDDAQTYQQRLDDLRRSAHACFFDEATGKYCDGRQLAMLFPLYVRITPDELRATVFDGFVAELNGKGYLDTGSPGLPMMFKCVVEDMLKPELLWPALTRTAYPSYGYFLARQESCWPEYWQVDGIPSRIHTCFTGVAGYFIRGLGGIQIDDASPGMQHVIIRPHITDQITYARTASASLYGPIVSNWKRRAGLLTVEVVVPANSTATVHLPVDSATDVTESGAPLGQVEGLTVGPANAIDLVAGRYVFEWALPAESEPAGG